jgi:hypothetical protein
VSKLSPREEFITTLADALAPHIYAGDAPDLDHLRAALRTVTEEWAVDRKDTQDRDDRAPTPPRYGHELVVTGPFVPETDQEIADREARAAARSWANQARLFSYDPQDLGWDLGGCPPPPERVGVSQLLDQGLWWRARMNIDSTETTAIRLEDMTHSHRLALLAFLRRNAKTYKLREDWSYASILGPSGEMAADAFEAECDRQWETPAAEWLESRPLIKALVYWTTPVAESPLTWRPMNEAPHTGTIMARWVTPLSDAPEHQEIEVHWLDYAWCAVGGTGPLTDELAEWRELPTPVTDTDQAWRPMDEAPRDGTIIMARWDNAGILDEPERVRWGRHGWYLVDLDESFDDDTADVGFDGWRPVCADDETEPCDVCGKRSCLCGQY